MHKKINGCTNKIKERRNINLNKNNLKNKNKKKH
jgi:hypothetical protein